MPDQQTHAEDGPEDKVNTLAICVNRRFSEKPSCAARGSIKLANAIEAGIIERRLDVRVERIVCFGMCTQGPSMRLVPGGEFYYRVKPEDVPKILDDLERDCGFHDLMAQV